MSANYFSSIPLAPSRASMLRRRAWALGGAIASLLLLATLAEHVAAWVPAASLFSEAVDCPVVDVFHDGDMLKASVLTPEGEHVAVRVDAPVEEVRLYRLTLPPSPTKLFGEPVYSDGPLVYSDVPLSASLTGGVRPLTLILMVLAILAFLPLQACFRVLDLSMRERYPRLRSRGLRHEYDEKFFFSRRNKILFYQVTTLWLALVLALNIANMFKLESGVSDLAAYAFSCLPVSVMMLVGYMLDMMLKVSALPFSLASRAVWGRAQNVPSKVVNEVHSWPKSWPSSWLTGQNLDPQTLGVLNPSSFEGTLGELATAARTLGP